MSYGIDEYQKLRARQRAEVREATRPGPEEQVAAVAAHLLTQQSEWNVYLERLQAQRDKRESQAIHCRTRIMSGLLVDHDELMQLKIQHAGHMSAVEALEWAMQVPKALMDESQEESDETH